jgi:2-polyprenyl-6-methoxyphenol hydroxylase-like FAD-dependent oxidoreductase
LFNFLPSEIKHFIVMIFDAVIIGSGMGALSAAALLAADGLRAAIVGSVTTHRYPHRCCAVTHTHASTFI